MSVDRGFTWMDDETIALIDIFSKDEVQQVLNGSKRNIGVYERIARELTDVGFRRTAYQCREKIKRLRKEYQLAKYCLQNNITQKKPMKHFDLVDKVFSHDSPVHNNVDLNFFSSDQEDEMHFSFNHDQESDASNSCTATDSLMPQSILPGPSCSPLLDSENSITLKMKSPESPLNLNNDSNDTLLLNGVQNYDCSDKDSNIDDSESPWVPNVVLVENDLESGELENTSENAGTTDLNDTERLDDFPNVTHEESFFTGLSDSDEPPQKKKKQESTHRWFKKMLDKVTDNFLKYQESTECRFLERITQLEQERMKRDESMQKLWMEFEERRRKEEQQHELKMMSLLGQFVHQISSNESHQSK